MCLAIVCSGLREKRMSPQQRLTLKQDKTMTIADPWTLLTTIRSTKATCMILVSMDRTGGTIGRRVPMSSTGALFVRILHAFLYCVICTFAHSYVCTLRHNRRTCIPKLSYTLTQEPKLSCCDALALANDTLFVFS